MFYHVGFDRFGSEEELTRNPIGHLYDVYVKISKISKDEEEELKTLKEQLSKSTEESSDKAALEARIKAIETEGVDQSARDCKIYHSKIHEQAHGN